MVTGTLAVGVLGYTLSSYIPLLTRLRVRNADLMTYRAVLSSALEYTKHGVKNRWCFTDLWTRDSGVGCNLTHSRSVERLLLNAAAIAEIKQRTTIPQLPLVGLEKIEQTISVGTQGSLLAADHPLRVIIGAAGEKLGTLKFSIKRINSTSMPTAGTEVFVEITVQAENGLEMRSLMALYPRELNTFTLIAKGDLVLGSGDSLPASDWKDTNIRLDAKTFSDRASFQSSAGNRMITFLSPIFSNHNLILPNSGFTPLVFADQVLIGGGVYHLDPLNPGTLVAYRPEKYGDPSQTFLAQHPHFGGLLRGVQFEASTDLGLEYLFGSGLPDQPDKTLMERCIARNKYKSDLSTTQESQVAIRERSTGISNGDSSFSYQLGLTDHNEFRKGVAQPRVLSTVSTSALFQYAQFNSVGNTQSEDSTRAILRVSLEVPLGLGGGTGVQQLDVQLGANSELEVDFGEWRKDYFKTLADQKKAELDSADANYQTAKDKYDSALSQAQEPISDPATGATTTPTGGATTTPVTNGTTTERDAQQAARDAAQSVRVADQTERDAAKSTKDAAQSAWDTAQSAWQTAGSGNRPKLVLKTTAVASDKVGFQVLFQNESEFHHSNFDVSNLKIHFEVSDFGLDPLAQNVGGAGYRSIVNEEITGPNGSNNTLEFAKSAGRLTRASSGQGWTSLGEPTSQVAHTFPTESDPSDLESLCKNSAQGSSALAFAPPDNWNVSFAESSRTSWNFKPLPAAQSAVTFTGSQDGDFHVYSIAPQCVVKSSATLVAGFFTCDELVIESRATPLNMVGTFIVGKLTIDPSAVTSGITFANIYHPSSIALLKNKKILSKNGGGVCPSIPDHPVWHPNLGVVHLANTLKCTPAALSRRADNFTWTAVDPVCGLISGQMNTQCKVKFNPTYFKAVEFSRSDNL